MVDLLTVSGLNHALKQHLWKGFSTVRVVGEVSEFRAHGSGHWYFTLKDPGAVVSCVMFSSKNRDVRSGPTVGDEVEIAGYIDMYPPQGKVNLVVNRMVVGGEGALRRRREELEMRLREEGLFDPQRKQPIPTFPRNIGVATSADGAALHDILEVTQSRCGAIPVFVSPCKVQGEGASRSIVNAMARLVFHGDIDVLILARGGGSQEDLSVFDTELVARAVSRCPIPVVSAVGHESDVSLADLVADVRAATPSHAAELVTPDGRALAQRLAGQQQRLVGAMERHLTQRRSTLSRLVPRHPRAAVQARRERVVAQQEGLLAATRRLMEGRRQRFESTTLRAPSRQIADGRITTDRLHTALHQAAGRNVARQQDRLGQQVGALEAMSPLKVLQRGFAVVSDQGGGLVQSVKQVATGDELTLRLVDGEVLVEARG